MSGLAQTSEQQQKMMRFELKPAGLGFFFPQMRRAPLMKKL